MQLKLAFRLALLLGTFGAHTSSAFVVSPKRYHGIRVRLAAKPGQQGWDNENYLEALSSGKDALNRANEEYYQQSDFQKQQQRDRLAAEAASSGVSKTAAEEAEEFRLTEELKKKIEAGHEEGPGGTRWKEMLKLAQQAPPVRPQQVGPPMYVPPVPQTPVTTPLPPVNPNELSVEEQARMFREMMQQQAQGYAQPPQPPQPPQYDPYYVTPARPTRPDPRPVGRNRDADAISNTSDLYLAQLKYDSSVRNIARYRGDEAKANAVFKDEGVHKLKDELLKNPYLTSAPQSMVGTSAEEYLFTQMTLEGERAPPEVIDVSNAGISYKEKLRQRQLQKQGVKQGQPTETKAESPASEAKVTPTVAAAAVPATTVSPPAASVPAATTTAAATTVAPPAASVVTSTPTPAATAPPQQSVAASPVHPQPVSVTPTPPQVSTPPPATATSPSSTETDALRGEIRTLMGLVLKHRGGPGFGAGRLKEPEIERFERLLSELTGKLQQESGFAQPPAPAQVASSAASSAPPAAKQAPQPQPLAQAVVAPPKPQPAASTSSAISMAETIPAGERIQKMISCIEGAVQMYKNSPPELQEGLLIPVRSALMTAVTTCNQVIAENELRNYEAYQALAGPVAPTRAGPPSRYFDVVEVQGDDEDNDDEQVFVEQANDVSVSTQSATLDGNSQLLEKIYQDLKVAAGDGKLGLKPNLTAEEASNLSNSLLDMRAILMEELDSGIPVAQPTAAAVSADQGASSNSKYQQLLAKARASKTQN